MGLGALPSIRGGFPCALESGVVDGALLSHAALHLSLDGISANGCFFLLLKWIILYKTTVGAGLTLHTTILLLSQLMSFMPFYTLLTAFQV